MKNQYMKACLLALACASPLASASDVPALLPYDCPNAVMKKAVPVANAYLLVDPALTEKDIKIQNVRSVFYPGGDPRDMGSYAAEFSGKGFKGKVTVTMTRGGCLLDEFQFNSAE